jgi:hypothetical protein
MIVKLNFLVQLGCALGMKAHDDVSFMDDFINFRH